MNTSSLAEIAEKITPILQNNGVAFAGIFGSYARGEEQPTSDIDFLVRFAKPVSLLQHGGLQMDLAEALKKEVDVVTEAALHPKIKENILKDLQVIYER